MWVYVRVCINNSSMQIYATWASSSFIFFKDRDEGAIVLLPFLIILRNKGEEEQDFAEPNIFDSQLEPAFINARRPNYHHVLTVGFVQLPALEGPAANTLLPCISFVPNQKGREHSQMPRIFGRLQYLQGVQESSDLFICKICNIYNITAYMLMYAIICILYPNMQINGVFNTCGGFRRLWMATRLLSSGIRGRLKLA